MDGTHPASLSITEEERLADRILRRALNLRGEPRQAYLDRACQGRPDLRDLVDDLLAAASDTTDPFLDGANERRQGWLLEAEDTLKTDVPIQRLGAYRLIEEIGRGGMGIVFAAQRADGAFEQDVAVKLVQQGASEARRQRFLRERQILASLEHPGIARLLDGGVTEEGQLFLVMERVDGMPIDTYCRNQGLDLSRRLDLFLDVCAAVSAAHRQLVVHRDLKPSNILVTESGQVKLLDFGIAKILVSESGLDAAASKALRGDLLTEDSVDATRVMTPTFASPEQFHGSHITVASDVYQLGLLLFLLITGRMPFLFKGLGIAAAARLVCEEPPPRASTAARQATDDDWEGREPQAAVPWKLLRGDLDTIVGKALAKEPGQRYDTVSALGADVRSYLDGKPIAARPPTLGYVARKFVQRRRWALIASLTVLLGVVGIVWGYTLQLRQERDRSESARLAAEAARDEAETLSRSLVNLFELSDPERSQDDVVDALHLLERRVQQVRLDFAEQPVARARLLHTLGEIYTKLAHFDEAAALVQEAMELRQAHLPTDDPEVIESVNQLGVVLSRLQRFDEAGVLLQRALRVRERQGSDEDLAMTLNNLGNLHWRQGHLSEAETLHRRALELRETLGDTVRIGDSANNLGVLLNSQNRYREAIPFLQKAADAHQLAFGEDHPTAAIALNNLGVAELSLGSYPSAEAHFRRAADVWQRAYGAGHPRTLRARANAANSLRNLGRTEEAVEALRGVLQEQTSQPSPDPVEVARTWSMLSAALTAQGYLDDAEVAIEQSIALRTEVLGVDHPSTRISRRSLGRIYRLQGRAAEAERVLRHLLDLATAAGQEELALARILHELALTRLDLGDKEEAETLLRRTVEIRKQLPEGHRLREESERALEALLAKP